MIELTTLTGKRIWINPHQIETMEANPDTTLGLINGKRMIVKESPAEVIERIVAYRRSIGPSPIPATSGSIGETE